MEDAIARLGVNPRGHPEGAERPKAGGRGERANVLFRATRAPFLGDESRVDEGVTEPEPAVTHDLPTASHDNHFTIAALLGIVLMVVACRGPSESKHDEAPRARWLFGSGFLSRG